MTWGLLKAQLRRQIWPDGEQPTLVESHDKSFLDAIIDLQHAVVCLQQNNTSLFPQCATFYKCGLTFIDSAPRGVLRGLSVIDKINPDTGLEDAEATDEFCSEIKYARVDPCHVKSYLRASAARGCCMPIPLFFGIDGCNKGLYPVPTDEGLPAGLPLLPMGFHYPQESTDRTWGRAGGGIWAVERGQIWVAPWINSTETILLQWDGIKREWTDADPVDSDPLLSKAIRLYVQAQHTGEWDHEWAEAQQFEVKYVEARAMLIRQCREETRERDECGGGVDEGASQARAANGVADIFYNDDQFASASCPDGTTGSQVSVTIPSGTIGSVISKADANAKAQAQSISQAQAQLDCTAIPVTYLNEAQTFTASCTQDEGAPIPDGAPVTVTVQAGEVSSTVSQAAANASALALAQSRAEEQLTCTFWNSAASVTITCPTDPDISATEEIAAHVYSSDLSQADADAQATAAATNAANAALPDLGCIVVGVGPFWNTTQSATAQQQCLIPGGAQGGISHPCLISVKVTVAAHSFSSATSIADANAAAHAAATSYAQSVAFQKCAQQACGTFEIPYGGYVHPG